MSRTSRRTVVFYVLALTATVMGLRLIFEDRETTNEPIPAPSASSVVTDHMPAMRSGRGGYMGTGRAQVTVEEGARPVAAPQVVQDDRSVQTRQEMDGQSRAEELKRVLANIDGEPVYVEGVDGPAPEKKKPEKR